METQQADILILGAGIGGYETFRTLKKYLAKNGFKKTITIVDQNNYFTFTPLLHEVASGSVEPAHATVPLAELVYKTPHTFVKAFVKEILPAENLVKTDAGDISYTFCVVALGSGVHYYGVPGAEKFSYHTRTLPSAMRLRTDLIRRIESREDKTAITIVGGGYTGVEVAGQLARLVSSDLRKLYPQDAVTISLVEASPVLAPTLPERAQKLILKRLTKLGVKVILSSGVKEVFKDQVLLANGAKMNSDFTVWCAGIGNVAGNYMSKNMCERDRLPVTEFLNNPAHSNLYGVGDIICGHNVGTTVPYPQLGEAAHKQGEYVAKHIIATMGGRRLQPFNFHSRGTLMPVGDRYGLFIRGSWVLTGLIAWWLRRLVYIMFVPGISRKLRIMWDWILRWFGFSYIIDIERRK